MRWIFISPHLDDAILSAGGLIYDLTHAGTHVEIWTLNCGFPPEEEVSPFAQSLHFQWGFSSAEETVRLRRAEDDRAAAAVGATTRHFDFLDCIYRRGVAGEWLYPLGVFGPPRAEDSGLPHAMTETLAPLLQPEDILVCQLGVGNHVDHVLVRRAVEALNRPLAYLADIPYLLDHPEALEPFVEGMQADVWGVSEAGLAAWVGGVAAYASQIANLFEPAESMREKIEAYGRQGVRLWRFE